MENQHIKGYRDLSAEEIALINRAKVLEAQTLALQADVAKHINAQFTNAKPDPDEMNRMVKAEPARWAALAKTDLQFGFMALVRAVAQPAPVQP